MGIKKELIERGKEIQVGEEGLIVGSLRWGKEKWRVVGVYGGRIVAKNREVGGRRGRYKGFGGR